MSLTVHVGLAKCASTSLQRFVFPELKKIDRNIEFNDENLTFLSYKCHVTPLNSSESCLFNKVLNNGKDHIVSSEFLINRDPFQWEESADINLEMFGKEANIVIIIKDTLPYLTSLYLQIIQEGRCISEKRERRAHNRAQRFGEVGCLARQRSLVPHVTAGSRSEESVRLRPVVELLLRYHGTCQRHPESD